MVEAGHQSSMAVPPNIQLLVADVLYGRELVLTGRTDQGLSVCISVKDAAPYLWVRAPTAWLAGNGEVSPQSISRLAYALEKDLSRLEVTSRETSAGCLPGTLQPRGMLRLTSCGDVRRFHRFAGYDAGTHSFFKLSLASTYGMRRARELLSGNPSSWLPADLRPAGGGGFELGEADIPFEVQACTDIGATPGKWFTLHGNPTGRPGAERGYRADIAFEVTMADIKPLDDRVGLAPIRVLSFDIETLTRDLGHGAVRYFDGDDEEGKLLSVGVCTMTIGSPDIKSVVFSLNPDAEDAYEEEAGPVTIRWVTSEQALFRAFIDYVNGYDPDVLTGYNTDRFDLGWLYTAAQRLGIAQELMQISRFKRMAAAYDLKLYRDKNTRVKVIFKLPGRIHYDLLIWMKKNVQLPQYKLDYVAQLYTSEAKLDVAYAEIGRLFQTHEGRVKLAVYCCQDTRLVLNLITNRTLDPLGKDLSLCSITGMFPADVLARGAQHTLRCKLLRVSRDRGFVLPFVSGSDADAEMKYDNPEAQDECKDVDGAPSQSVEEAAGFRGGLVMRAQSGRYKHPVAVMDFASLYPSVIEEMNICPSTSISRSKAAHLGLKVLTPPAPSLSGAWMTPHGLVSAVEDYHVTPSIVTFTSPGGGQRTLQFTNELNEAVADAAGKAILEGLGYALRWDNDELWTRRDEDVLCFVDAGVRCGIMPQLERDLKAERKQAKREMAAAEAAGDEAAYAFYNNKQASIKVIMNAAYGGLGCRNGGLFPRAQRLAEAITATGRAHITSVRKAMVTNMWLNTAPDATQRFGIGPKPDGARHLTVIYGDTDSVFCHFEGLTLREAGAFGSLISAHFQARLPKPHCLEFEKVYMPFLLWRRKLYAGMKYESYDDEHPASKMHSRGIALVRRDCAPLVRNALRSTLQLLLQPEVNEAAVLAMAVECVRLVSASARTVHDERRPDEHLPLSDFELSGGLSKNLDEYDSLNAQGAVASRLMELFPLEKLGKGTRVTFVHRAEHIKTKRASQAVLVSDLVRERLPLDVDYYTEAVLRKLCPVLSALFGEEEKRGLTHQTMNGGAVEVQHRRASERSALVGQTTAEKRLRAALADAARGGVKARDENAAPPARMLTLAAFARPATGAAAVKKKPAEKRKAVSGASDAFAALMAGSAAASAAQGAGDKRAKAGVADRTLHAM